MANRGRHRKRHVKCVLHMPRYHESWISKVLDDNIISLMLHRQLEQGNFKDLLVFEKNPNAGRLNKGFTWSKAPEGHEYWENIMDKVTNYKQKNNL